MQKTVSIICPASPASEEDFRLCDGFFDTIKYGDNCRKSLFDLAGRDEERAADVMNAFAEESDAVFAMRGGYGSARLLDKLDYELLRINPKPLFGYSDITALQLALWHKSGLVSYSGFMPGPDLRDGGIDPLTFDWLQRILATKPLPTLENLKVKQHGKASGILLGGCLSLLVSMIGSDYLPDFSGAILFLEEVKEPTYKVDRMMRQLLDAGIISRLSGLVFGAFTGCEPRNSEEFPLDMVLSDYSSMVNGPVLSGLPYGHVKSKVIMPVGVNAFLDGENGTLSFEQSY